MTTQIQIQISTRWVETAPNGDNCLCCGEIVFLKAYQLEVKAENIFDWEKSEGNVLCQSCYDAVK